MRPAPQEDTLTATYECKPGEEGMQEREEEKPMLYREDEAN
jgi:hypothetical protein